MPTIWLPDDQALIDTARASPFMTALLGLAAWVASGPGGRRKVTGKKVLTPADGRQAVKDLRLHVVPDGSGRELFDPDEIKFTSSAEIGALDVFWQTAVDHELIRVRSTYAEADSRLAVVAQNGDALLELWLEVFRTRAENDLAAGYGLLGVLMERHPRLLSMALSHLFLAGETPVPELTLLAAGVAQDVGATPIQAGVYDIFYFALDEALADLVFHGAVERTAPKSARLGGTILMDVAGSPIGSFLAAKDDRRGELDAAAWSSARLTGLGRYGLWRFMNEEDDGEPVPCLRESELADPAKLLLVLGQVSDADRTDLLARFRDGRSDREMLRALCTAAVGDDADGPVRRVGILSLGTRFGDTAMLAALSEFDQDPSMAALATFLRESGEAAQATDLDREDGRLFLWSLVDINVGMLRAGIAGPSEVYESLLLVAGTPRRLVDMATALPVLGHPGLGSLLEALIAVDADRSVTRAARQALGRIPAA